MARLTLSVDRAVAEQAKLLARRRGLSVSAMFTQFVRAMASQEGRGCSLGLITRQATGLATLPDRETSREVLEDALIEKHGLPGNPQSPPKAELL